MLALSPAGSIVLGLAVGLAAGTGNHLLATWGLAEARPAHARSLPGRFVLRLITGVFALFLVFWLDGSAAAFIAALFGLLFWRNVLVMQTLFGRRGGAEE